MAEWPGGGADQHNLTSINTADQSSVQSPWKLADIYSITYLFASFGTLNHKSYQTAGICWALNQTLNLTELWKQGLVFK